MKKVFAMVLIFWGVFFMNVSFASEKEENIKKQVVMQFYQKAINDKDFIAARQFLGPWYIQHNPMAKDGIDGFEEFINYLSTTYPQSHSEIKRILVDGDYVILHVHSIKEPGTRGQAIIDVFRLENNKIVEHWDVIQSIPDESANANGMF